MPQDSGISSDMRFEELIKGYTPAEQFLARQIKAVRQECEKRKYCYPQTVFSRKQVALGIGSTSAIAIAIIKLAEILVENL